MQSEKQTEYQYIYQFRPEMLSFIPTDCRTFLEVGCSDGSFAEQLKNRPGAVVWGVEMHAGSAAIAETRLNHVFCGDFLQLTDSEIIPENHFDCIIFNDVLEHFTDYNIVLNRVRKLLRPRGFLVTSLPNFRYVGNLWEIIIDKDFRYKPSGILDETHYRFFTEKSIRRILEDAQFEVLKSHGVNGTNSFKVRLLNILTLNFFSDIRFLQIATLAQLKKQG
jgi:2-polyprenyl-3-methyl-5-hydroxy-6-metoxy-1,4-benzoquinol methylase